MFEPSPDALVANRYRLVREIGRGGMGAVWEAFDSELDAPCALKFILNQNTKPPEVRARFLREARAVARLQSPHVVNIRSVGEWEGALYIAMELLAGETLFDRLSRVGHLSPRDTSRVVAQVASVLTVSHAVGIVHRDLKPENIWLWSHDDVFVKVLDFGVAKQVFEDNPLLKTATGTLVGTPYYMSPEQAAGDRHVDHRSDVWSLAIIAAECLSGKRPFQTAGLGQLLASIITGPTPKLTELYEKTTPALSSWWDRATAKDPNARYESAQALANALSIALDLGPLAGEAGRRSADANQSAPEVTGSDTPPREPHLATSSLSPLMAPEPPATTEIVAVPAELFETPTDDVSTAGRRPAPAETVATPPASSRTPSGTPATSSLRTYGVLAALVSAAAVVIVVKFTSEPEAVVPAWSSPHTTIPAPMTSTAPDPGDAPTSARSPAVVASPPAKTNTVDVVPPPAAVLGGAPSSSSVPSLTPRDRSSPPEPTAVPARLPAAPAKVTTTAPRPVADQRPVTDQRPRPATVPKPKPTPTPAPAAPTLDRRIGF